MNNCNIFCIVGVPLSLDGQTIDVAAYRSQQRAGAYILLWPLLWLEAQSSITGLQFYHLFITFSFLSYSFVSVFQLFPSVNGLSANTWWLRSKNIHSRRKRWVQLVNSDLFSDKYLSVWLLPKQQICMFSTTQSAKGMEGYVGFANLPNQVFRKSVKKGFEFTVMVVGR